MDDHLAEIKQDVKEIKVMVIELVKQGAIQNTTLIEHERRSTNLEGRFEPIEKDFVFRSKLYSSILGCLGAIAALIAIWHSIH